MKCNNAVAAARVSNFRGNFWSAYDRLPAELRAWLRDAVVNWDPRQVRWLLNKGGGDVARIIAGLCEAEWKELADFALCWPSRLGVYPARAAGASVVRWGSARRRRPIPTGRIRGLPDILVVTER
jgi:hypothetical protein